MWNKSNKHEKQVSYNKLYIHQYLLLSGLEK